jgi:LEA14-like dessication related protein
MVRRGAGTARRFRAGMSRVAALAALLLALGGCAGFGLREPLRVDLVGIEPLQGEAMESRFLLKLRVQNPNEAPLEYDGLSVELVVGDSRIASGVSDRSGTIPRFGETVIALPLSLSVTTIVRRAIDLATGGAPTDFELRGRLAGPGFGSTRFRSRGALDLPFPFPKDLR